MKCEKNMLLHVAYNTSIIRTLYNVIHDKPSKNYTTCTKKTKSTRNLKHLKKQ